MVFSFEVFKIEFWDIFQSSVQIFPLAFVILNFQSYLRAMKNMHPSVAENNLVLGNHTTSFLPRHMSASSKNPMQ